MMPTPSAMPFCSTNLLIPFAREPKPSTGMAMMNRARNITGARKKIPLKGLLVAGFRSKRIWVSDQRNPEKKDAAITRIKPRALNSVSPATIITTPTVMVAIIKTSLIEGVSRWNRKAKRRINAKAEDLHIASRAN